MSRKVLVKNNEVKGFVFCISECQEFKILVEGEDEKDFLEVYAAIQILS